MGRLLFAMAVVGNAVLVVSGLLFGLVMISRRWLLAQSEHRRLAIERTRPFHHPDPIRTSTGEWLFMAGAFIVVMLGLPVALAALFQFVIPALGRAWNR